LTEQNFGGTKHGSSLKNGLKNPQYIGKIYPISNLTQKRGVP
jgi:hypothetical protein